MSNIAKIFMIGIFLAYPLNNIKSKNNSINIERIVNTDFNNIKKDSFPEIYGENSKSLGIEFFDFYRLIYSDKEDRNNPYGKEKLELKTREDLLKGINLRDSLENIYDEIISKTIFYSEDSTNNNNNNNNNTKKNWGRIVLEEQTIPEKTYVKGIHEALDIFADEGSTILSPFNGLVIASGDNWEGKFYRGQISEWNGKGLTPRSGNALIIYNPIDEGYLLMSHFKEGLKVTAGDVISKGQILGYVGHSGSASIKGHGEHIHAAYKLKDKEGYLRGINFREKIIK